MTHPAVHWPTLSPETHFQRSVRCFPQRPRSLHALLDNAVALNPQGTALVCNDTRLTYLALNEQVGRLAAGWHALGLNAGDRVALLLSNRIAIVLCLLAATRLGAITVPLSVREQTPGLHYMLDHCGARLLVHDAELHAVLPEKNSLPVLQWRVSFDGCADALDFDSLLADGPLTHAVPVNEEDTVVILYTSGTTGRPTLILAPLAAPKTIYG
jgi:long-chain acyl-CoA synthetase